MENVWLGFEMENAWNGKSKLGWNPLMCFFLGERTNDCDGTWTHLLEGRAANPERLWSPQNNTTSYLYRHWKESLKWGLYFRKCVARTLNPLSPEWVCDNLGRSASRADLSRALAITDGHTAENVNSHTALRTRGRARMYDWVLPVIPIESASLFCLPYAWAHRWDYHVYDEDVR